MGLTLALFTGVLCACAGPQPRLYDELGGKDGIRGIVDDLFLTAEGDVRVSGIFRGPSEDIPQRKEVMVEYICHLAGGPCEYRGKDMKSAHAGLRIDEGQFYAMVEDMRLALRRHNVSSSARNRLEKILAPMRDQIVER